VATGSILVLLRETVHLQRGEASREYKAIGMTVILHDHVECIQLASQGHTILFQDDTFA
jgi:hypothetical protein